MDLCDMVSPYLHNFDLNNYMMKVFLVMKDVLYVALLIYEVHFKACSLPVGLLIMCEVVGLHM